jgi:hypothetical protein
LQALRRCGSGLHTSQILGIAIEKVGTIYFTIACSIVPPRLSITPADIRRDRRVGPLVWRRWEGALALPYESSPFNRRRFLSGVTSLVMNGNQARSN